jgi:Rrf2 family protein
MNLSSASTYALHAVACLAQQGGGPLSVHTIAQERCLPEGFLLKILRALVAARILRSSRGPRGGYRLLRSPAQITLLEILEASDGPIRGEAPPPEVAYGSRDHRARLDAEWVYRRLEEICRTAALELRETLRRVTLAELVRKPKGGLRQGEEEAASQGTPEIADQDEPNSSEQAERVYQRLEEICQTPAEELRETLGRITIAELVGVSPLPRN